MLLGTKSYSKTKTSNGITVKISGSVSVTHGINNNTFGGTVNLTTTKGSTPKKINTYISHEAFGIVGSGGIGKVYSGKVSYSCSNKKTCKSGKMTRKYTASTAYSMTRAYADVTTKSGKKLIIYGN
ncbi:hypothetical protein [Pseudogracilibacillus sp. SO30301A]|uniref:hypothetical protein n=1 Tax=Pseudogracilibacillus sp. SO30301A TaxID=3098291 RepID=UPI00300E33BD